MTGDPNRWAATAGLVAVAVVLIVETLLVAETFEIAHRDTQPPSRWSQTAKEIFFGGK